MWIQPYYGGRRSPEEQGIAERLAGVLFIVLLVLAVLVTVACLVR
jgi:hypothetical protein